MRRTKKLLSITLSLVTVSAILLQPTTDVLAKEPETAANELTENWIPDSNDSYWDHEDCSEIDGVIQEMHRFYNFNSGDHHFTTDQEEISLLQSEKMVDAGWKYEGHGTTTYRIYEPNSGVYHFTPEEREVNALEMLGWTERGSGFIDPGQYGKKVFALPVDDVPYTGRPASPDLKIYSIYGYKSNGETYYRLTENVDYLVESSSNIEPGTVNVQTRTLGSFRNVETTYRIVRFDLDDAQITGLAESYTWNGEVIEPEIEVTAGKTKLIENEDYTISWSNNDQPGTAQVTVTGTGKITGSQTKTFSIVNGFNIADVRVDNLKSGYFWSGSPIEPSLNVYSGNKLLDKDRDYRVEYKNNNAPGTAEVEIIGIGDYSGSQTKTFNLFEGVYGGLLGTSFWTIDKNGVLLISEGEFDGTDLSGSWPWESYIEYVKKVDGSAPCKVSGSLLNAFRYCPATEIDLSGWDTSEVTSMSGMFAYNRNLTKLNVASLDTSSVTDMSQMFYGCTSMTEFDLNSWNTSNVQFMGKHVREGGYGVAYTSGKEYGMFGGCSALKKLDLSGWNTSSLNNMCHMFSGCTRLVSLDLSGWDTSKTGSMIEAFSYCHNLETIDISSFSTQGLKRVAFGPWGPVAVESSYVYYDGYEDAFYRCESLIQIKYNQECIKLLESLPIQSGWILNSGASYSISNLPTLASNETATLSRPKPKIELKSAEVTGVLGTYVYTGKAINPKPVVKSGNKLLKEGTDYVLSYSNNIKQGIGTVTIEGIGAYSGTVTCRFVISASTTPAKTSILKVTVKGIEKNYNYIGKAIQPTVTLTLNGKTLVKGQDYTVSYSNNINPGTATIIINGIGNYDGSKTVNFTITKPASQTKPAPAKKTIMHRLYNPNSGEHFYTSNDVEKNHLVSVGWKYEGEGWKAPEKSSIPVYRLYNPNAGDHHYTLDKNEKDTLEKIGWKYEGIGWYSDEAKGVPLYRQYNPNAKAGSHNYTTNKNENDGLVKLGWKEEGIGWYGMK